MTNETILLGDELIAYLPTDDDITKALFVEFGRLETTLETLLKSQYRADVIRIIASSLYRAEALDEFNTELTVNQ